MAKIYEGKAYKKHKSKGVSVPDLPWHNKKKKKKPQAGTTFKKTYKAK